MHTRIICIDSSSQEHGDTTCCRRHCCIQSRSNENLDIADDVTGPAVGEIVSGPDEGVHCDEEEGNDGYYYERTCCDVADAVEESEGNDQQENKEDGEDWEGDGVGGDGVVRSYGV